MQTPRMIEFRMRQTGEELLGMPLYDFLREIHQATPTGQSIPFEALEIIVDGEELLPGECGHA